MPDTFNYPTEEQQDRTERRLPMDLDGSYIVGCNPYVRHDDGKGSGLIPQFELDELKAKRVAVLARMEAQESDDAAK